jgi:hypothetical protein
MGAAQSASRTWIERGRKLLADDARWRWAVLGLAAFAFVIRLVIAAGTGGGEDLRLYHAFGGLVADGLNPYHLPAGFAFPHRFADNLPGELFIFAGVLKLHDAAYSLRVLFALADAGVIALVGLAWPRPRTWRAAFVVFYALNPLVLGSWTATSEDKTFLFLLFAATILAVEVGRLAWGWAGTTALAAIKGFSLFYVPMLALYTLRQRGWRVAAICVGAGAVALALAHLPWFPDDLDAYANRDARTRYPTPGAAAITQVLGRLHIYDPAVARIGTPLLLVAIFLLFWRRLIGIVESMVLASAATLVLQPEHAYTRALFAALPFLLILRTTTRRWIVIWVVATLASIAIYFQQERGQLGGYGSMAHVVCANALFFLLLGYYLRDRWTGAGVVSRAG